MLKDIINGMSVHNCFLILNKQQLLKPGPQSKSIEGGKTVTAECHRGYQFCSAFIMPPSGKTQKPITHEAQNPHKGMLLLIMFSQYKPGVNSSLKFSILAISKSHVTLSPLTAFPAR
jgi:hypothetical protein